MRHPATLVVPLSTILVMDIVPHMHIPSEFGPSPTRLSERDIDIIIVVRGLEGLERLAGRMLGRLVNLEKWVLGGNKSSHQ